MPARIRPAERDDETAIEAVENAADRLLIERLEPETWEPAPSGASRAADRGFILVAEDTETRAIIGFVHVLEVDELAHLEQLSVHPNHGRRGYGRRLVEAAEDEARRRGYAWLSLRTYADVPWNAPFYARLGFVETTPATDFHQRLAAVEQRLALEKYGRRVQMSISLDAALAGSE